MKISNLLIWIVKLTAAIIMLQTLFFKFTGASESVFIFSQLHVEPWGRIGTGIAELIASILILIPRTSIFGALLAFGIMAGALLSHLFIFGIVIQNDGGFLFGLAITTLICSSILIFIEKEKVFKILKF